MRSIFSGIPYITIDAQRKARAIVKLVDALELKEVFFLDNSAAVRGEGTPDNVNEEEDSEAEDAEAGDDEVDASPASLVSPFRFVILWSHVAMVTFIDAVAWKVICTSGISSQIASFIFTKNATHLTHIELVILPHLIKRS